jgi:hypothetical protein
MFGRANPHRRQRGNGGTPRIAVSFGLEAVGRPDVVRTRPEALQVMDRAVRLGDAVEPGPLELAIDVRREHPDAMRKTLASSIDVIYHRV